MMQTGFFFGFVVDEGASVAFPSEGNGSAEMVAASLLDSFSSDSMLPPGGVFRRWLRRLFLG